MLGKSYMNELDDPLSDLCVFVCVRIFVNLTIMQMSRYVADII